jgi:hypothetical protein
MVKPILLLLCCVFLSRSLLAQAPRTDTALPQKLQFKKADFYGNDQLAYFIKKLPASSGSDSVRSLMYLGPPVKRDSFQLQLPVMKNINAGIQIKAVHHEPLYRQQ